MRRYVPDYSPAGLLWIVGVLLATLAILGCMDLLLWAFGLI